MARKRKQVSEDDSKVDSAGHAGPRAKKSKTNTKINGSFAWSDIGMSSKNVPQLLVCTSDGLPCTKFAGFDIDWTIIATKTGKTFSQNAGDWKLLYDKDVMVGKLQGLVDDGYQLVFFTNQAGVEKGHTPVQMIKDKIGGIIAELGLPIWALVSTGESHYRKPSTGMFYYFAEKCNGKAEIALDQSMYVGDAAGRLKNWKPGKKKDFSASDRKFAENIGVKFLTPEEFFLDEKPVSVTVEGFNPAEFMKTANKASKSDYHSKKQELVLLCGCPGSGKSYFASRYLVSKGYVEVNRDTLQTQAKCLKAVEEALSSGKSVVVDNTNPSKSNRAEYISLTKKNKIPVRCFKMNTPPELAHHLNYVRQNLTLGQQRRVPDVAYNVYKKHYEEPELAEGFSEIVQVDFVPDFSDETHRQAFLQWT